MRRFALLAAGIVCAIAEPAAAQDRPDGWSLAYGGNEASTDLASLEERGLAALGRELGRQGAAPCQASGRLVDAARSHARYLAATTSAPGRVDPRIVRRDVLRTGSVDASVVPWALSFRNEVDLRGSMGRLARRLGGRPPTHCGAGLWRGDGRSILVLLASRRRLELDRFPTSVAPGDRVRLSARLEAGYESPSVLVTTPRGDIREQPALGVGQRFSSWLDFPTAGRYTVEVMAEGHRGPEVVALFPVFSGARPRELEAGLDREDEAPPGADDAVESLARLVNDARHEAGLRPLELDDELSALAAAHSADMNRRGYFGHVSPSGSDVVARLRDAGFVVLRAAENLARSTSPPRAHQTLMASPSHRANVLDGGFSHFGVGVARRGTELVVTQIFVEW